MNSEHFNSLFAGEYSFNNLVETEQKPPLLAHYTSFEVMEKIISNNELWMSNPLFMNDLQEMRFGMIEGLKAFQEFAREPAFLEIFGSKDSAVIISDHFHRYYYEFENNHALDVYVFCLSEHDPAETDGRLSMWRGYGGNGSGAAIVFDTGVIKLNPGSPLLFVKVDYASEQTRIDWFKRKFRNCAKISKQNSLSDDQLPFVALQMFSLMKIYALTSKHPGFSEEIEWRMIYLPERDSALPE